MVAIAIPAVLAALSCLLPSVSAAASTVVDPIITLPAAGMQWPVGSVQKVNWEYPGDADVHDKKVTVLLGHMDCEPSAGCSENLDSGM